ncbi:imidazole glycerol phosphate synthase subunit HisH [Helicobacter mustelae]|uniref:Imidazole glycerol phosphate synthase subunit HisH n=1 Tax=Helicobacter mustelae (strain ATCC 43772 / CCUG 25715 / CIP 103759 / LMG 18044 / NCTC 12198 / R85-136P) TaxID=679897 RepID=D3UI61_HELM1|nr:imidazole glycerol phosphate synthase subunit HisH [Helicobacter mustelae]CBG40184.1 putative imidazole glycerol phosphate synthase subunit [Helicobacter mustelae 12198]SQH71687.1 imidazole glycerol phosphate synthase subunit [Helicobacter mustelae]STP12812.1 imidazole glycerol phosphate synthase subunit [Helicobacter mustelae]
MKIGIIDYGAGNIGSVLQAFGAFGVKLERLRDPDALRHCDKLVLPGVGAFGDAIMQLRKSNMEQAILEFIKSGKYFLGICVGMQLLFERGFEFGEHRGLGIFEGDVRRFDAAMLSPLKIPHIGWNLCLKQREDERFFKGMEGGFYLYFVHSFHAIAHAKDILATCEYGVSFPAIVQKENVYAIQPHPEKSDKNGLKLLQNFTQL